MLWKHVTAVRCNLHFHAANATLTFDDFGILCSRKSLVHVACWIDFVNQEILHIEWHLPKQKQPPVQAGTAKYAGLSPGHSWNHCVCKVRPRHVPCGQMGQVRWLNWFHTWQAWSYCYVTPQGTTRRSARSSMCSCNLWLWLIKWTSINLVKWSFSRWLDAVHWADLPQDLLAELARQCFAAGIVHDFSGALFGIFWILVLTARDSPVSSSQFTLY